MRTFKIYFVFLSIFIACFIFLFASEVGLCDIIPGSELTYDYTDTTNNKAYEGEHSLNPPATLEIGTEVNTTNYSNMANSDDTWATFSTIATNLYEFHRFKFNVGDVEIIKNFNVLYEGYATSQWNSDLEFLHFLDHPLHKR